MGFGSQKIKCYLSLSLSHDSLFSILGASRRELSMICFMILSLGRFYFPFFYFIHLGDFCLDFYIPFLPFLMLLTRFVLFFLILSSFFFFFIFRIVLAYSFCFSSVRRWSVVFGLSLSFSLLGKVGDELFAWWRKV